MSYTLIKTTNPKAKKEYSCIWCAEKINIGEVHTKEVGEFEGDFQSNRWHTECHNAAQMYFNESGENCFYPHENKRGSTEEKCQSKKSTIETIIDKYTKLRIEEKLDTEEALSGCVNECLEEARKNIIYWRDQAADEVGRLEAVECELNNVIAAAAKNQGRLNSENVMHMPVPQFLEMKKKLDDCYDWLHLFVEIGDGDNLFDSLHKKYGEKYKTAYGWRTEGKCSEQEQKSLDDAGNWIAGQLSNLKKFEDESNKANYVVGNKPNNDTLGFIKCPKCHDTKKWVASDLIGELPCDLCADVTPILKPPSEWQKEMPDVIIIDIDGWRLPDAKDWNEPITRDEYLTRRSFCTCKFTNTPTSYY